MRNSIILQKFYQATKIPLQHFDDNKLIHNYDSEEFYPNPAINIINYVENTMHSVSYTVSPEYLFYGIIKIKNSSEYLIVGPTMALECTRKHAQDILVSLQQSINRTDELLRWFRTIPLCDMQRFRGTLSFLNYILNGNTDQEFVHIPYQANSLPMEAIDSSNSFIEHIDESLEKEMLSCVEFGNLNALEIVFKNLESNSGEFPLIASDATRSYKNIFIHSVGIVSRAALKGGLDFDTVHAVSNSYLIQIEKVHSYTDIYYLLKHMFSDFTRRTAQCHSFLTDSFLINKICKYVQSHLYEKITPTSISEHLKMNCSYLCREFKKETGKTITEFINELKIKECTRLLETTEIPLIQISTMLGFSSQNYFHTVFKKITKKTPNEYRNNRF